MRARLYRGIPVFTTDVSSLYMASPIEQAAIAICGLLFQVTLSFFLLLVPVDAIRIGASLSILSATFAAIPLPGTDGYWFLSDIFRTKIVVTLGKAGHRDLIGLIYAVWLVVTTGYFAYILLRDGIHLAILGWTDRPTHVLWSMAFVAIGTYAVVVAVIFGYFTISFLRSGETKI